MATKTLILRPIRVGASDESLMTLYPSDTTISNAHLLVNEEVADDDATYVSITGAGTKAYYYFQYNKPEELISITDVAIKTRDKLESGSNAGVGSFAINNTTYGVITTGSVSTSEYNELALVASNSDSFLEAWNNATSDTTIEVGRSVHTNSSKASPIRTTQVYIEITYEASEPIEPDPEPTINNVILTKKNGLWTTINYISVYCKNSNSWVLSDDYILQNNQKYTIKEVE